MISFNCLWPKNDSGETYLRGKEELRQMALVICMRGVHDMRGND